MPALPEITDCVIVGGGVLGAALAYELTRRTVRVVLLESHALASGVSGSGFAWVNALSKQEDEAYHRLNAQGLARYDALAAEWGAEAVGLNMGGALYWAGGAEVARRERLRQSAALMQGWQYPVAMLHRDELAALEPDTRFEEGAEGLFAPADRWLDAPRTTRFFADRARRQNAEIQEYAPVVGFTVGVGGAITGVQTAEQSVATRWLILAAGAQTPALAARLPKFDPQRDPLPIERRPGLLVETAAGTAEERIRRILYPPDAGGLHLRPTPSGGLLIGADDTDGMVREGAPIPAAAVESLLERASQHIPAWSVEKLREGVSARICVRPVPADDLPIVGALPGLRNVFVAVTHSGVTLAPILAHYLSDQIINERTAPEIASYAPNRFAAS